MHRQRIAHVPKVNERITIFSSTGLLGFALKFQFGGPASWLKQMETQSRTIVTSVFLPVVEGKGQVRFRNKYLHIKFSPYTNYVQQAKNS
jgi:hypothetical protein